MMSQIQLGYKKEQTSILPYALLGILIGFLLFDVYLFRIEPFYSALGPIILSVTGAAQAIINPIMMWLQGIYASYQTNPAPFISLAIPIGTAILIPLIKTYYTRKSEQAQQRANAQILEVQNNYSQVLSQKTSDEAKIANLQKEIADLKSSDNTQSWMESQQVLQQQKNAWDLERAKFEGRVQQLSEELTKARNKIEIITQKEVK